MSRKADILYAAAGGLGFPAAVSQLKRAATALPADLRKEETIWLNC